jgi:hypothetical protein
MWLKQHGQAPLTLLDVVPSSDLLRCEIEAVPASPNYRIYVTAVEQATSAGQTNSLTLKMRDQLGQERSIPVSVLVGPTQSGEL